MLDAPPTGRIAQFLGVNNELAGLARMGPIKSQADSVTRLFRSPQTACHLVTVLEEMPVQETADGIAELRRHRIPVGGVVVNQVRPRDLDDRRPHRHPRGQGRQEAGCRPTWRGPGSPVPRQLVDGPARRGAATTPSGARSRTASARWSRRSRCRRTSSRCWSGGIDLGGLYELAELLRDQGLA